MTYEKLNIKDAKDTTGLQVESLLQFAAALGYQPVYDMIHRMRYFRAPQFDGTGTGYISVNNMIKMHNDGGYQAYYSLRNSRHLTMKDFMANKGAGDARDTFLLLFAASLKVVHQVKGQHSRKRGLFIQSPIVELVTKQDRAYYTRQLEA